MESVSVTAPAVDPLQIAVPFVASFALLIWILIGSGLVHDP
jgi:hypothetical protein